MRSISAALLFCLTLSALVQASPLVLVPETVIADPAQDPYWSGLFTRLAPQKTRYAHFEEHRLFPFRKAAVVLTGELRLDPQRGLSLNYSGDKPHVVIVDAKGVMMRDQRGRDRAGPADGRAEAATSALFDILRFDLPSLAQKFVLHGIHAGNSWTLGFEPRDQSLADLLGALVVYGSETTVDSIQITKSEKQRIDIFLKDTKHDVQFTADELKRFFR